MDFKELEKLKENPNILAIFLFGSYAYGRQHKKSDIDICIFTEKPVDILDLDLPEKYDVHLFDKLPLFLKAEVLRNGKPIFIRDPAKFYKKIMKIKKVIEDEELRKKKLKRGKI